MARVKPSKKALMITGAVMCFAAAGISYERIQGVTGIAIAMVFMATGITLFITLPNGKKKETPRV